MTSITTAMDTVELMKDESVRLANASRRLLAQAEELETNALAELCSFEVGDIIQFDFAGVTRYLKVRHIKQWSGSTVKVKGPRFTAKGKRHMQGGDGTCYYDLHKTNGGVQNVQVAWPRYSLDMNGEGNIIKKET